MGLGPGEPREREFYEVSFLNTVSLVFLSERKAGWPPKSNRIKAMVSKLKQTR